MMRFRTLSLVGVTLLLGACSGNGTLRLDSKLSEKSAVGSTASGLELGGGLLVIDSVQIAVSETEFEGGKNDSLETELGAAVIDVAVDGTDTVVTADSVTAGAYHTFGMELAGAGAITVSGTYDSNAFTFSSANSFEAEFPLEPPVEVPAGGEAAVAVTFDVAAWFTASDGSVLDPTDAANQSAIDSNIRDSIAAFAEIEAADGNEDAENDND